MTRKVPAILIAVFIIGVLVLAARTSISILASPAVIESTAAPDATAEATTEAALVGDPVRGKEIFENGLNGAPPCKSCHTVAGGHTMFAVAPNLKGISTRGAMRIPDMTAPQYIEDSIRRPTDYVVSGFHISMYPDFGKDYSDQDIADLVAYLMTL